MKTKGEYLLNELIAVLVILTLTVTDALFVGVEAISYAVDSFKTNSENVEFTAYFLNNTGEKVEKISEDINREDLKLYVEVSVKEEGYFNGEIKIGDGNFNLKSDILNDNVNSIEGNTVKLNQINAGTPETIELGIEAKKDEGIKSSSLNMNTQVILSGTYVNSKKDTGIEGTLDIGIEWISNQNTKAELDTKVLTNGIFTTKEIEENVNNEENKNNTANVVDETEESKDNTANVGDEAEESKNDTTSGVDEAEVSETTEVNKRVVQLEVNNKITNNNYPVKNTKIDINIPEEVEKIDVYAPSTNATNKNLMFSEKNYKYNKETKVLTIEIANNDENISWSRNTKDRFIITCTYPSETDLTGKQFTENTEITTYDNQKYVQTNNNIIEEEKDGFIGTSVNNKENEIYKGKLYLNEKREFVTQTSVEVTNTEYVEGINVEENTDLITSNGTIIAKDIEYKQTVLNKDNLTKILGEDGTIKIYSGETVILQNSVKNLQANESGNIVAIYPQGIKNIKIETSKPKSNGILKFLHTKVISNSNKTKEDWLDVTEIKQTIKYTSIYLDKTSVNNVENTISLLDTSSNAEVDVNLDAVSTINENDRLMVLTTLKANSEQDEVYKNPTIRVKFPKQVTRVSNGKTKLMHADNFKIENAAITTEGENKVLTIKVQGEQTQYTQEAVDGLQILLYVDLELDKFATSSEEKIIVEYTNENRPQEIKTKESPLNIQSKYGLFLYSEIDANNKQVENVDGQEKTLNINLDTEEKRAKVDMAVLNNYDKDIENACLVGSLANNTNTFNTKLLSPINVEGEVAAVYYSEKENIASNDDSWTTTPADLTNVKSYKIELNDSKIKTDELIKLSYEIEVPDDVDNAKKSLNTLNAYYTNENQNFVDTTSIGITTTVSAPDDDSPEDGGTPSGTEESPDDEQDDGATDTDDFSLTVTSFAKKGNQIVQENDSAYVGETIEYFVQLKNNGNKSINNIKVVGKNDNVIYYDLAEEEAFYQKNINTEDEDYSDYQPPIVDEDEEEKEDDGGRNEDYFEYKMYHYYAEVPEMEEKVFETIDTLQPGEEIELRYQVVVKEPTSEDGKVTGQVTIEADEGTKQVDFDDITIIKEAEVKANIRCLYYEEDVLTPNTLNNMIITIKNTSGNSLENAKLQLDWSENFQLDSNGLFYEAFSDDNGESILGDPETVDYGYDLIGIEGHTATFNLHKLEAGKTRTIVLLFGIKNFDSTKTESEESIQATVTTQSNKKYLSNTLRRKVEQLVTNISAEQECNIPEDQTVYNNANVIYTFNIKNEGITDTKVGFLDRLMPGVELNKVYLVSGNVTQDLTQNTIDDETEEESEDEEDEFEDEKRIYEVFDIKQGESVQIVLDTTIDDTLVENGMISNYATIIHESDEFETNSIQHYVQVNENEDGIDLNDEFNYSDSDNDDDWGTGDESQSKPNDDDNENDDKDNPNKDDDNSNGGNHNSGGNDENNEPNVNNSSKRKYSISGMAWLDVNKNGSRDPSESKLSDLNVWLLDVNTNELVKDASGNILKNTTDSDGNYQFNDIEEGSYIVIFEYNTDIYEPTEYNKSGISENMNSNAVEKKMNINNENKVVGVTDNIKLNSNKSNINIGLVEKNVFDLSLNKSVSKIEVLTGEKSKTYTFNENNNQMPKVDIASKDLDKTTVVIQYKIKVTNEGNITGYVGDIIDYLPNGLTFNSNMNSDWYKDSDGYLHNKSLSNAKLQEGQSTEVNLILTKEMKDQNTGLIANNAEIGESSNDLGIKDKDSTEKNKSNTEDDFGYANVLISVKTGAARTIGVMLVTCIISALYAIYYLRRRRKLNE